jgi:outer membrane protein
MTNQTGLEMKTLTAALLFSFSIFSGIAHATDNDIVLPQKLWFVHVGAAGVLFDSGLVTANNPAILNTTVTNNFTASLELGRYLTDQFSVSLSAGLPPTNDVMTTTGAGTNKTGSATYGSLILDAQYHFNMDGDIRPYVGAGVAYNMTFNTSVVSGSSLKIDNNFGAVLQAGVEAPISENVGVFLDVKKMFATAHATKGALQEDIRLNPWIISAGVSFSF